MGSHQVLGRSMLIVNELGYEVSEVRLLLDWRFKILVFINTSLLFASRWQHTQRERQSAIEKNKQPIGYDAQLPTQLYNHFLR